MNEELKPCPFCNEEAHTQYTLSNGRWYVTCGNCHASTTDCLDRNDAIKAWNNRKMPLSVIESLEDMADKLVGVADCCEDCPAYGCGLEKASDTECKNAIAKTLARAAGWNV